MKITFSSQNQDNPNTNPTHKIVNEMLSFKPNFKTQIKKIDCAKIQKELEFFQIHNYFSRIE